jgi:hypothetical protein
MNAMARDFLKGRLKENIHKNKEYLEDLRNTAKKTNFGIMGVSKEDDKVKAWKTTLME